MFQDLLKTNSNGPLNSSANTFKTLGCKLSRAADFKSGCYIIKKDVIVGIEKCLTSYDMNTSSGFFSNTEQKYL